MLRTIGMAVWVTALALAQAPLPYEIRHVEKKSPGCLVSFEYPEITSAAPEVRDRINAGILQVLLRRSIWPASDSGFRSLDEYANTFVRDCEEVHAGSQPHHDLYERKTVRFFRVRAPIFSFQCVAD